MHIGFSDGRHFEFLRKAGKHAPEVGTIMNVAFDGTKESHRRLSESDIAKLQAMGYIGGGSPAPQ